MRTLRRTSAATVMFLCGPTFGATYCEYVNSDDGFRRVISVRVDPVTGMNKPRDPNKSDEVTCRASEVAVRATTGDYADEPTAEWRLSATDNQGKPYDRRMRLHRLPSGMALVETFESTDSKDLSDKIQIRIDGADQDNSLTVREESSFGKERFPSRPYAFLRKIIQ